MKLLILGGTRFLGRALVESARAGNHEVTLFNRGQSNPGLFPDVENLVGDRDGGLDALHGRTWDAVIDTCGYVPRLVGDSARLLTNAVGRYTFISTISVYADLSQPGIIESSPLGTIADETVETITGETYGPLKVLCEQMVNEAMGANRALHVRSGLIVGPYDSTDRFTYWPARLARGGETLAPGNPEQPIQFVDVRDIAHWIIQATEQRLSGPYNVTGPAARLSIRRFLETAVHTLQSNAQFTWVNQSFLLENEIVPFADLPLWVPASMAGFGAVNNQKAQQAGLTYRPLTNTIRDTQKWQASRPADYQWQAGLTPEREQELLAKWHGRTP